jgi:hypothetical protein
MTSSSSSSSSSLPPNLMILSLVRQYGKIPRGFLYDMVPAASNNHIDQLIADLERRQAIKVDGDYITLGSKT